MLVIVSSMLPSHYALRRGYTRKPMNNRTSRFIANEELWNEIYDYVAKGKNVCAAIAYFGRDGARLLPFKEGDRLVVDMSIAAVRQGLTDPRAVRTLMTRGVRVFSRGSLHAKFIVAGRTLIASSANASHNSKQILDEAGIITTDPAAVQRAVGFFNKLCTEPVGKKYLAKCVREYRPPQFKVAVEIHRSSKRSQRVIEAKLWFVGGLVALELSDKDSASMKRLERRAEKRLQNPASTEVRWIRYARKPKFLRSIRIGDWIIDCMKEGRSRNVGPPARVLGQEAWTSSLGKKYDVMLLESPTLGESMPLSEFRKKVRSIEPSLDKPSPRTRPIQNNDHADRILRRWTLHGKIAKPRV